RLLAALVAVTAGILAYQKNAAATVNCEITSGNAMQQVFMDLSNSLTSGTNVIGKTKNYQVTTPGSGFWMSCTGNPGEIMFTNLGVASGLQVSGREGPWTYYKVDEYFSIGFMWNDCSGTWYVPVRPFSSSCGGNGTYDELIPSGGVLNIYLGRVTTNWTVRLKVDRAFSGPRPVNLKNVFNYYYGDTWTNQSTLQTITLSGTITV
ncbi:TPA: hypothetical protein ACOEAZ_004470, partial [Enterobacter asburiae]